MLNVLPRRLYMTSAPAISKPETTLLASSSNVSRNHNNNYNSNNIKQSSKMPKILNADLNSIAFSGNDNVKLSMSPTTKSSLEEASKSLHQEKLVVIPTETVYGLAGSALSQKSALNIFTAKQRPADNPLIVHISSVDMLDSVTPRGTRDALPEPYKILMQKFWPGPLTLLFPAVSPPDLPSEITANLPTVAVRMPSHPVARALIHTSKLPLAAPSANLSGRPSPTTAVHSAQDLAEPPSNSLVDYVLDGGPCNWGIESTVVDGVTEPGVLKILRPGAVSYEELVEACDESGTNAKVRNLSELETSEQSSKPSTPGMKYKHYSPSAKVIMLNNISNSNGHNNSNGHGHGINFEQFLNELSKQQDVLSMNESKQKPNVGLMIRQDSPLKPTIEKFQQAPDLLPFTIIEESLGKSTEPIVAAQNLFSGLRKLDEVPCSLILLEKVDEVGVGRAVVERSLKACGKNVVDISIS